MLICATNCASRAVGSLIADKTAFFHKPLSHLTLFITTSRNNSKAYKYGLKIRVKIDFDNSEKNLRIIQKSYGTILPMSNLS